MSFDDFEEKQAEYGKLTCEELREKLRKAGAKRGGKKKELIERLIWYEKHSNFGNEPEDDATAADDERMLTPVATAYKDLHAGCPLPAFDRDSVTSFLSKYDKRIDEGEMMYKEGYLLSVRFARPEMIYYVKGRCKAMMKKNVQYEIDASMTMEGEIQESSCECPGGSSVEAHCKHVIILLLAIVDMCSRQDMILNQTCTQKIQNFHRLSKKFNDSPQKAEEFINKNKKSRKRRKDSGGDDGDDFNVKKAVVFNLTEDYKIWYINHFRNVIVSNSYNTSMPVKMIIPPANLYAVNLDHDYLSVSIETQLLRELKLVDVTPEEILRIEYETRGQSNNELWHFYRSCHISCSKFHKVCHVTEKGVENLVSSILYPKPIWSRPTMHGIRYEQRAVDDYNSYNLGQLDLKECGLFLSAKYPFICGTPDRLIYYLSVLEVKCPYTSRNRPINEVTVPYLRRDENGDLRLRKDHPYYYQVQGQMFVTNRSFCDFVVWAFFDMHHESIERDDEFIQGMVEKLVQFFEQYLRPAILKKYLYRNTEKFC